MTLFKKLLPFFLFPVLSFGATTSALYLLHERSTLAALEGDLQNREIGLDISNKTLIGKFSDGTKFHLISQEQTTLSLAANLTVTGTLTLSSSVTPSLLTASQAVFTDGFKALTSKPVSGSGSVVMTSGATLTSPTLVTPILGVATATSLNLGGATLANYDANTFTATGTGFTSSPTGTAAYTRIGNVVTLRLPEIYATSNATSFTLTGLPAPIQPATTQIVGYALGTDNSVIKAGTVAIQFTASSGTMTFLLNGLSAGWTAANLKGNGTGGSVPQTIIYTLQ